MGTTRWRLTLSISAVIVAGCAVEYRDSYPLTDLAQSEQKQVQVRVLAKAAEWLNTGVIVKKGLTYDVQSEGRWHGGPICGWTGADGQGAGTQCFFSIIHGWSISTLIGRVGESGEPIALGGKYQFSPPADGILYLRINEPARSCIDNEGFVTSKISVINLPKAIVADQKLTPETIEVRIKGIDDGVKSTKQQDYKEAVLFAKREAIERAGVEMVSVSKVTNMQLYEDYVEAKAQAILLGGYEVLDLGYSEEGIYQVVLVGKIKMAAINGYGYPGRFRGPSGRP